jgi:hypothetical protein
MAWYVIYDNTTGRLESESNIEIEPKTGKTILQLAERPSVGVGGVMWDETTRTFIVRPPKVLIDRWEDFQTSNDPVIVDFRTAYNSLNAANKTRVREFLIAVLGRFRYRNQSESVRLE